MWLTMSSSQFTCVSGVTGEAISENIISNLTVWQLQPHLLRGEAYDGAGGMSRLSKDLLGDWHDAWLSMLPIQEHGFIREHLGCSLFALWLAA